MPYRNKHAVGSAWIGWAVLFVVVAANLLTGSTRTVVMNYRLASLHWIAGKNLYDGLGVGGFTYLPQSALLFLPFALLPAMVSEVLWRLLSILVFAAAIRAISRLAAGRSGQELFPLVSFFSIPLAWDCARNGQATLIMAGLMLFAVVDIAHERWWRATLWLVLSVAFKPLAVVLLLLVAAIDRPMTGRTVAGAAVLFLVPFLMQRPAYVLQQYADFLQNTTTAAHVGAVEKGWTTLFNALGVFGIAVQERVQTVIRLGAALGTLVLCAIARRRYDAPRSAIFLYSLAAAYLMLFSPRTENNTYAMLGPAIALFLSVAYQLEKRRLPAFLLGAMVLCMLGSRTIEHLLTPAAGTSWVSPLLAICFTGYLVVRLFAHPERQGAPVAL